MPTRAVSPVSGLWATPGSPREEGKWSPSPLLYVSGSGAVPRPEEAQPLRPDTLLAGLPRLVRVADETRWRAHTCVATAIVLALFWVITWLVGEPVRIAATALAAAVAALPTVAIASLRGAARMRESLDRAGPPPRASVHETLASARDRRVRLAGVVLTGIIALLIFDRFTGGGGLMAGLLTGALGGLGAVEWVEARRWDAAERERETRVFVMIRPDALSPRLAAPDVYETPRPGRRRAGAVEPSPFDLDV